MIDAFNRLGTLPVPVSL